MASIDPLTPVAPAPSGVTPDFYSVSSLQVQLSVLFGVTYGIATILMCLRLYTGIFVVKKLYFDARECTAAVSLGYPAGGQIADSFSVFLVVAWVLAGTFFLIMAQGNPSSMTP